MTVGALFLIPGFGLGPDDYAELVKATRLDVHAVDIWPKTEAGVRDVGRPGTPQFDAWFQDTLRRCEKELEKHPDVTTIFAHSAGYLLAKELAKKRGSGQGKPVVAFGVTADGSATTFLHGRTDSLVKCTAARVFDCGHFGCVSGGAARRCRELQRAIGSTVVSEAYVDCQAEIGRAVREATGAR